MSYYRRGYSWENIHYIGPPVQGWNPDTNPWELPEAQAPVLDNFLIRPGKIIVRGGFKVSADLSASSPLDVCGYALSGNTLIARKNAAGGTVDPWNAPLLGVSAGVLASGLTGMLYVSSTGVITPVAAANADQVIGPRWINFDGLLYGISYDSAAAATTDVGGSYHVKPCSLLTLPTTTGPGSVPAPPGTVVNDATFGVQDWDLSLGGGVYSVNMSNHNEQSHFLLGTNCGFNIPAGATITGIQADVLRSASIAAFTDNSVCLFKNSLGVPVLVGTDHADAVTYTTTPTLKTYGGPGDLWGTALTPADINNANFGVGFSSTYTGVTTGLTRTAFLRAIRITVYYTISLASSLPTVLSNAPHGAFDLKGWEERVWLLGGINTPGGGTSHSATTLFFTNPIAAGGGTASADWKDPVSGLTNQIKMDNDTQDFGVALATVRGALLILRRSSLWILRGSTTASYAATLVSKEVGCVDARSVVETDTGVYFLSQRGLMFTDGTRVTNVSGAVMYTLKQAVNLEQQAVMSGLGGYATCALTSEGQILVSIGAAAPGGHIAPIWSALRDPTGAWVRITSQLWVFDGNQFSGQNCYPGQVISSKSPQKLYALGDKYVTMLEDSTANFSFLQSSQLYDQMPSGGTPFLAIAATWKTRYVPIVGTTTLARKFGQAKRFFLDYLFASFSGTLPNAWTASPVDATDTAYDTMTTLIGSVAGLNGSVSGLTPSPSPQIQRQDQDFASEISDLAFDIAWRDVNVAAQPTGVVAELYGIGVEYQPTRDLR